MSVKILTVVVYGVDESHPYVGMVVGYQHNVKKFLALWVEFPQSGIHCLQCLRGDPKMKYCTKRHLFHRGPVASNITLSMNNIINITGQQKNGAIASPRLWDLFHRKLKMRTVFENLFTFYKKNSL